MKKRTALFMILTFTILIICAACSTDAEKQTEINLSDVPSPSPEQLINSANELKYGARIPYKILSIDLDTMTAVLEIDEKTIEVPVEHKEGRYCLIHTEESRLLLNGAEFSSALPNTTDAANLFETLPESFWFESGAGAWSTGIRINPDGTFTGEHSDSDMGDGGEEYPYGTLYFCQFNGKFSQPEPINEYIYVMRLEYIETDKEPDTVTYAYGVRYISSYPYGLDNGDEFLIYMPNTPFSCIPEQFLSWCETRGDVRLSLPSNYYGIYNINGGQGFNGRKGHSPAYYSTYDYTYENRKSSLWPSDCYDSSLVFFPEEGAAAISLKFAWNYDGQREFDAVDDYGSGSYHISISHNDDYSKAAITVTSKEGHDLSPWGGTADGTLTAVYTRRILYSQPDVHS